MKRYFDDPSRLEDHKAWRDRILFYLLVLSGYRGHEIAAMRWKHCYNFKRDAFREAIFLPRRMTKGARAVRAVWVPQQLRNELVLWKARYGYVYGADPGPDSVLISSVRKNKGRRLTPESLWRIVKRDIYDKACVGPEFDDTFIGVHSGRKYAVNKRYRLTHDAADACRFAGHAQPETTMRYISSFSREQEEELGERMHI